MGRPLLYTLDTIDRPLEQGLSLHAYKACTYQNYGPLLPPGQGGEWGFELYKFQMPHMWGITISQIPALSPPLKWGWTWVFDSVVIEHAQPHGFKRSNSPPMGHALASKLGQMPHLIPTIAREGVVGYNIDRWITRSLISVRSFLSL